MSLQNKKKADDPPEAPDSTTKEKIFNEGEDVLLQHNDGRYYLGTIVEVNLASEKCLIKFGDNTENWSHFKDLSKFALPESSDLLCVMCKKSQPKSDNAIIVCDKCGRGYHQLCHQPSVEAKCDDEESEWFCRRCTDSLPGAKAKHARKEQARKTAIAQHIENTENTKFKLNYDPESLTWDPNHRTNLEERYCYCSRPGSWFMQMLQCGRCRQWFHENCLHCLQYPLYCGDRFYIFVCSSCNYGKEFIRRLEIKLVDIIHLVLFNLTVFNAQKYYDLDTIIMPYINNNWSSIQLPPKILHMTSKERKDNIMSVLSKNRNRFKCGREIKKRATIWGLRIRNPPPAPKIKLPASRPITDAVLKELWHENKRLKFLPPSLGPLASSKCQLGGDLNCSGTIIGGINSSEPNAPYDSRLMISGRNVPALSNRGPLNINFPPIGLNLLHFTEDSPPPIPREKVCIKSGDYSTTGFAKKSTTYAPVNRLSLEKALLRRRLKVLGDQEGDLDTANSKELSSSLSNSKELSSARVIKRRRPLHKHQLNSVHPDAKELSTRKALKLLKNAIAQRKKSRNEQQLPPTPPTSSASETPQPPSSVPSTSSSSPSISAPPSGSTSTTTTTTPGGVTPATPVDTSGDDETSSRGTLDAFIPPPKDFEGKNHPFRLNGTNHHKQPVLTTPLSGFASLLPMPLGPVQRRPTKRQLSEKDIRIDRNGEVKRRRRHHRRQTTTPLLQRAASKQAAVVGFGVRNDEWTGSLGVPSSVSTPRLLRSSSAGPSTTTSASISPIVTPEIVMNGRRLRGSTRRLSSASASPSGTLKTSPVGSSASATNSPVKQDISLDELKSSVNIYFGAANRIASGERFTVRGKRATPSGRTQYLIEWDGPSTS